MYLGQLIARLRSENDAGLALESLNDFALFSEIAGMGEMFAETPGEYMAGAASRFANQASNEDWLQLVSCVEGSGDPGRTLLQSIVRWSLARDRATVAQEALRIECNCSG